MALADVADLLACPVCPTAPRTPLELTGTTLRCPAGHAFDLARQGYVNLLGRAAPAHADTAAMVAARERFLDSAAYAPVADALTRTVLAATVDVPRPVVVEAGAGPAWYLTRVLDDLAGTGRSGRGLALDISPAACRRATVRAVAAGTPLGVAVADVWAPLPLRDGVADVVLSVFAPRHPTEFARVLAPGGALVVVTPQPDHLRTLRAELGLLDVEPGKQERLGATLAGHLEQDGGTDLAYAVDLDPAAVRDLVAMGPNAFHGDPDVRDARLARRTAATRVEVAVRVGVWRRPHR